VLKSLAQRLKLPKLNLQNPRRMMAMQAQNMGSVTEHSGALAPRQGKHDASQVHAGDSGENSRFRLPHACQARDKAREADNLQQNATKPAFRSDRKLLEGLVGTAGFEPTTSTV